MSTQDRVLEFHQTFRLPHGGEVGEILGVERIGLRLDLIDEELAELCLALAERDLVEIADGLGDLVYVIYGMAVEMGLDLDLIIEEVHRSNMTKLWQDWGDVSDTLDAHPSWEFWGGQHQHGTVVVRDDGKVMKPPTFQKPRIYDALKRQGWTGR